MHEYGIVQSLLACVEKEATARAATAVRRITVRIGELSGVEGDLLKLAYETFREQTLCAEAEMEIINVAADWDCPACAQRIPRGAVLRCSSCNLPARLCAGSEIILEQIEMEVRDV